MCCQFLVKIKFSGRKNLQEANETMLQEVHIIESYNSMCNTALIELMFLQVAQSLQMVRIRHMCASNKASHSTTPSSSWRTHTATSVNQQQQFSATKTAMKQLANRHNSKLLKTAAQMRSVTQTSHVFFFVFFKKNSRLRLN